MGAAIADRTMTDAYVRSTAATTRFGAEGALWVIGGSGGQRISYLQTPMPCPARARVVSAKLQLRQVSAQSGNRTLALRRVTSKWQESKLTWSNRPARVSTPTASVAVNGAGSKGRLVEFDVTVDVQRWVNGDANYGWTIESSSANQIAFYSKESAANGPRLVVEWATAPERPQGMQPNAGLIVSDPTPLLQWQYADRGSVIQPLSAMRVQMKASSSGWSAANGFTSPTFDSGVIDSTLPQLDLTGVVAPLEPSQFVWWTARHRDASGLWSDWGDPQLYGYVPLPTVTLDAPTATVNDTTWTWKWSTSDQARFQLLVVDPVSGERLWSSGVVTSTTQRTYDMPRGAIRRHGQVVEATVTVWDSANRQTATGAPMYVTASRQVTYTDSSDVAPVTSLEAFASPDRPTMRLTWRRSAPAAQYGIWLDGLEVEVLDAEDVSVAGGGFAYDLPAGPRAPHVATVKAIVETSAAGVTTTRASADNVALEFVSEPVGVWLIVPDDPTRDVRLLQEPGQDLVSTTMPEVVERLDPIGSPVSVQVTSALRWFEGSVSGGVLADYGDLDADTLRQRVLRAKGDRLRPYTLIWGSQAVPVFISNVNVTDDRVGGTVRYLVSFDFAAAVPSPEYELL